MQLPDEFSPFIEKKVVFCLVVRGVTPLPPLSGPTTKKTTIKMILVFMHPRNKQSWEDYQQDETSLGFSPRWWQKWGDIISLI